MTKFTARKISLSLFGLIAVLFVFAAVTNKEPPRSHHKTDQEMIDDANAKLNSICVTKPEKCR